MKTLTIREVRTALTNLDQLVATEGEVLVTKRGKAIARLLPVHTIQPMPSHADLRKKMRPLSSGSESLIREDRDGRR